MNEFYSNNQFSSIDLCFKRVWLIFNRLEVLLLCCITIFANFWVAQSDDGASPRMAGTAENGADSLEPPAEGARPTEVAIESWSSFVLKVDWAGFQPILLTEPNTKAGDWKVSCFVDVFCVCVCWQPSSTRRRRSFFCLLKNVFADRRQTTIRVEHTSSNEISINGSSWQRPLQAPPPPPPPPLHHHIPASCLEHRNCQASGYQEETGNQSGATYGNQ